MQSSIWAGIKLVWRKELLAGMRFRASWCTMLMFALTTMACISLALQGAMPEPRLQAALIWLVLFFSSTVCLDRLFAEEDMGGTLTMLRVYAPAQAVLFGKMLYAMLLLAFLAFFVMGLFLFFMELSIAAPLPFLAVLVLGLWGVAVAGTFIAALAVSASVKSGLAPVLMLPVILPVFLPAIFLTAESLMDASVSLTYLGGMALYDMLLTVGASLLFDYIWYEE